MVPKYIVGSGLLHGQRYLHIRFVGRLDRVMSMYCSIHVIALTDNVHGQVIDFMVGEKPEVSRVILGE